ncbi:DNA/RNA helicase [Planoprotostelium fungivorum]|uniref:DNA/RNA helicase n=1 Tax=Planoprotostelium fungivorum TaxID=1890364 RepID=A0A2P6N7I6_9EUKA|nr:DNA/RNA helicase [Planoprotostelium fungivorum]
MPERLSPAQERIKDALIPLQWYNNEGINQAHEWFQQRGYPTPERIRTFKRGNRYVTKDSIVTDWLIEKGPQFAEEFLTPPPRRNLEEEFKEETETASRSDTVREEPQIKEEVKIENIEPPRYVKKEEVKTEDIVPKPEPPRYVKKEEVKTEEIAPKPEPPRYLKREDEQHATDEGGKGEAVKEEKEGIKVETKQLKRHQKDGIDWLIWMEKSHFKGGILADEMGNGKTAQMVRLIHHGKSYSGGPTLVIVPNALIEVWKREISLWAPDLTHGLWHENNRATPHLHDVIITTHGTIKAIAGEKLRDTRWNRVIVDEAHVIKNNKTEIHRACSELDTTFRWCVTGTPLNNKEDDVISLFQFLGPSVCKKWSEVLREHKNSPKPACAKMLSIVMLKREKIPHELPEKHVEDIILQGNEEEKERYGKVKEQLTGANGLVKMLRLRRQCDGVAFDEVEVEGSVSLSPTKFLWIVQKLKEIPKEEKMVIFSTWTAPLLSLESILKEEAEDPLVYNGELSQKDRENVLKKFETNVKHRVLLITVDSGGVGLTLTTANHVVILEPQFNPAKTMQAIDRVHRLGQTREVYAYRLLMQSEVEERCKELCDNKELLVSQIVKNSP